jgi:hypothetical protein
VCCEPGQIPQQNGTCAPPPPPPICPPDRQLPGGLCCPLGSTALPPGSGHDLCKTPPNCLPANRTTTGLCCPLGTKPQTDGTCVPKNVTICAPNELPGTGDQTGTCVPCPAHQSGYDPKTKTQYCCPIGTKPQLGGKCVPPPGVCPPDQVTFLGWCCPFGYEPAIDGQCALMPVPACLPGLAYWPDCCVPTPGGVCLGVHLDKKRPPPDQRKCDNGLLPREAFRGDEVCVTQAVRDQTIADNAAAPGHTNPNGGCMQGYVWREARVDDHVCVPLATRTQTWSDNRRQCGGDVHCKPGVTLSPKTAVAKPAVAPPKRMIFRPRRPDRGTTTRSSTRQTSKPQPPGRHRQQLRGGSSNHKR